MQCNSVDEGNFFKDWAAANNGVTVVYPQPVIDNQNGNISDTGIAVMTQKEGGASGNGVLYTYHFTALADQVTAPTIVNARIVDSKGNMLMVTVNVAK